MANPNPLLAGIELGGTKCICVLGTAPGNLLDQVRVPTADPAATLEQINSVLDRWTAAHGTPVAIGLASFGPLDLRASSPTYGGITSSVKHGWAGTNVVERLTAGRGVPTEIDTDVNAAALAEGCWGGARGLLDYAYVTVGTGVGVGLVVNGRPVHGCNHPELGHVRIARCPGDQWPGACPYHGDCVEGLASGPAIAARAGVPADQIPPESPLWEPVAHALSQLFQTLVLATAPRRILVGGGVIECHPELRVRARALLIESISGYLDLEDLTQGMDRYIVAPGLGSLAGPMGALALAARAAEACAGSLD